jgi:MoaA/NifB/PqqE/SkfB family radical SAM enzyme
MNPQLKKVLMRIPAVRRYATSYRSRPGSLRNSVENILVHAMVGRDQSRTLADEIRTGTELSSKRIRSMCASLEKQIAAFGTAAPLNSDGFLSALKEIRAQPICADPIVAHRDIGKAIFDRDPNLYIDPSLPAHLKRFTYPAYLSIHLNEHCNAACFFCRDHDFKGRLLDFEQLNKLDSAFRMARVLEFTGWGEPFFYPKLEQVIDKCLALNSSPHLFSFTTNGSMLSATWGKKLSGKIHRLCISINASSDSTYEKQMRYKNKRFTFDYVVGHIREFMAEITPADVARTAFHMVANTDNFREIPSLIDLAANIGIPTVTIGNYTCADERYIDKTLLVMKREYNCVLDNAYRLAKSLNIDLHARRFFTKEARVNAQDTCVSPFERLYAEVPGEVAACCFMGSHRMGNIYDAGVEAVWFSEQMQALRMHRHLPSCSTCTLYNPFDDEISHLSSYLIEKRSSLDKPVIGVI